MHHFYKYLYRVSAALLIMQLAGNLESQDHTGLDTILQKNPFRLQDTILLEDVTVSVLPFGETYLEAAGGIFTLNRSEIDLYHPVTAAELYNIAPGVYMSSGTHNTHRMVIRGVGSRTPYGTNRIRAYLDDIPLTSGDGISTLEDLDPMGIGEIEILKGPSSALYGSGLGGIVRVNSPYPGEEGFTAEVTGRTGSFGTGKLGFFSSFKKNRVAATGGLTRTFSEGFRQNSRYIRNNFFLNTRYFGNKTSYSFTLSLVDLSAGIPSSLNGDDFRNEPEKAANNWLEAKGFESYIKVLAGTRIKSEISPTLRNNLVLFGTFHDPYELRPFNVLDERSFSAGFREYLEYNLDKMSIHAGLEYFHEWFNWKIFETLVDRQGKLLSDHDETRVYGNLFALTQWRPAEGFLIDAGFNVNLLQYSIQTGFRTDSLDQSGTYTYRPVLSPRIGISIRLFPGHHLYISAGHGFSAPSLEETLLPEGTVNTGLKPETGWNLEIGSRGRSPAGRITYDATIYSVVLRNMLVTERITEEIFTGINAGRALNTGIELWTAVSLFPGDEDVPFNTGFKAGYTLSRNTFLDFVDDGTDYSGNYLPGIPAQRLNTIVNGRLGNIRLEIEYQYTGGQWMDDANSRFYGDYHLFHARTSWKHDFRELPAGIEVYAGVRNTFDAHHASMILVNAPSFGGSIPRYYYPGMPRHFQLGLILGVR